MRRTFAAVALLTTFAMPAARADDFYSCPLEGSSGDQVTRGFYVTNYPGATLDQVSLVYRPGSGDGTYTVSLTARANVYNGPTIGATQTKVLNFVGGADVTATFDFGNAPVAPGSTVTFTQVLVSGPVASPVLFYDVGVGPCADITQTNGTAPPLDTFRRDSVGVTITGSVTPITPAVSVTPVPTLAQYALALLAALVGYAGLVAARRRS